MKKFYNVNISKIANNITRYNFTGKELKAAALILRDITFADDRNFKGGNIVKVTKETRELIANTTCTKADFYRKVKAKMIKSGILEEVKKDTYKVNNQVINKGYLSSTGWEEVKFMKVNIESIFYCIQKADDFSAKEVALFFQILNMIDVDTNIFIYDKDVKESFIKNYNVSARSLDTLFKKMKDMDIIKKLNNKEYKINDKFISCKKFEDKEEHAEKPAQICGIDLQDIKDNNIISFIKIVKDSRKDVAVADERINQDENGMRVLFEDLDACYMQ